MKAKLFNSLGCEIDKVDGKLEDVAGEIMSWLDLAQDGDVIKILEAKSEAELEAEQVDNFNWVGSRHHY